MGAGVRGRRTPPAEADAPAGVNHANPRSPPGGDGDVSLTFCTRERMVCKGATGPEPDTWLTERARCAGRMARKPVVCLWSLCWGLTFRSCIVRSSCGDMCCKAGGLNNRDSSPTGWRLDFSDQGPAGLVSVETSSQGPDGHPSPGLLAGVSPSAQPWGLPMTSSNLVTSLKALLQVRLRWGSGL